MVLSPWVMIVASNARTKLVWPCRRCHFFLWTNFAWRQLKKEREPYTGMSQQQTIHFKDLGKIAYDAAWDYQEQLLQANLRIKAAKYGAPEVIVADSSDTQNHLLFCEHPHVYTLGKKRAYGASSGK